MNGSVLLDTHAVIWLAAGDPKLSRPARQLAERAANDGRLLISVISVWEIALLESKQKIALDTDCQQWIDRFLAKPGVRFVPLSPEIAVQSTRLPEGPHGDPADRILIATARGLRATLLTADARILAYAAKGHLAAFCAS
jgi:PIN domain nuclease of toxin-antitoxin system